MLSEKVTKADVAAELVAAEGRYKADRKRRREQHLEHMRRLRALLKVMEAEQPEPPAKGE